MLEKKIYCYMKTNQQKKIPDPCNPKEHYQSFIRKKSKVITYQSKTFQNLNVVDITLINTEHTQTSHKLPKSIKQVKKKQVLIAFYIEIQKTENRKCKKITNAFKGDASSNVTETEILNSFNPELQLKDNDSAIKSDLIDLLAQLKGFEFVTTLVLVFKNIESEEKKRYDTFYSNSKAEIIINNKKDIDNMFQSIYTKIISNIQESLGKS